MTGLHPLVERTARRKAEADALGLFDGIDWGASPDAVFARLRDNVEARADTGRHAALAGLHLAVARQEGAAGLPEGSLTSPESLCEAERFYWNRLVSIAEFRIRNHHETLLLENAA